MKIVIINCAESQSSHEYFTMLTKNGFIQADELGAVLQDDTGSLKPDIIYASPFIRAIQTIYPYCIDNDTKVRLECSLYPVLKQDSTEYYTDHKTKLPSHFRYLVPIVDRDYNTELFHTNVKGAETDIDVNNRIKPFLYNLKKRYSDTDKTVLIVTHIDTIPYMLEYICELGVPVIDIGL